MIYTSDYITSYILDLYECIYNLCHGKSKNYLIICIHI